jgi:hypothetical protein
MTYHELVVSIKKLPPEQRLSLMEVLAQSLKVDMSLQGERASSLERVRGMLKGEEVSPSKDDLENDYTDYLIKKYT